MEAWSKLLYLAAPQHSRLSPHAGESLGKDHNGKKFAKPARPSA